MDDLIGRQAAIAVADSSDYAGLSVEDCKKVTDEVVKGLKQLPSAQPEIVRCKDCKHYKTEFCAIDLWTDEVKIYKARPDDFCSRAARRE